MFSSQAPIAASLLMKTASKYRLPLSAPVIGRAASLRDPNTRWVSPIRRQKLVEEAARIFDSLRDDDFGQLEMWRRNTYSSLDYFVPNASLKLHYLSGRGGEITRSPLHERELLLARGREFLNLLKRLPTVDSDVRIVRRMTLLPQSLPVFLEILASQHPRVTPGPRPSSWSYLPDHGCPSAEYHLGNVTLEIESDSGAKLFPYIGEGEVIMPPSQFASTFSITNVGMRVSNEGHLDHLFITFASTGDSPK